MNCDAYRLLITGYIDGELSDHEMHTLKAHLQTCEECLADLKRAEAMKTVFKRYTLLQNAPEVPVGFARNITDQVQEMVEEERIPLTARIKTAYRAFVLDLVDRWVNSLRTRPFAWTTLASCLVLVVAGVMFFNAFHFSFMQQSVEFVEVTPETVDRVAQLTSPTSEKLSPDLQIEIVPGEETIATDEEYVIFAEEPFIRMAQNDTESVENYIYSHVTEVYQDQFVDDAVFVGYVQNAFTE